DLAFAEESDVEEDTPSADGAAKNEEGDSEEGEDKGDEESLEERLKKLEEELKELGESHKELTDEKDRFVLSGHEDSTIKLFGRIQADLWGFPGDSPGVNGFETGDNDVDPADRILFRRLRIGVEGDVWKNIHYPIEKAMAKRTELQCRHP